MKFKELDLKGKQQWVEKFKLGPAMAWLEAMEATGVGKEDKTSSQVEWLTCEQLGGPMYLNSATHAKALFDAQVLPMKLHAIPFLARCFFQNLSQFLTVQGNPTRKPGRAIPSPLDPG